MKLKLFIVCLFAFFLSCDKKEEEQFSQFNILSIHNIVRSLKIWHQMMW